MTPYTNPPVVERPTAARGWNAGSWVAVLVLLTLLVGMYASLRSLPLPPDGLTWSVPLPRGGIISVRLWTHDLAFSPAYTTGGLTRQTPGPLRLTIQAQRSAATLPQRLAVLPVPAWPLLVPAVVLALGVLAPCYRRVRHPRSVASRWPLQRR